MSRRLAGPAFIVLMLLAGCAEVGPDYHLPAVAQINHPAAQGGFISAVPSAVEPVAAPDRWWTLYQDPVLDGLITQALAANTDLRLAAANLARARAVSAEVGAQREVDVSARAGAQRARLSGESYLLSQPLPPMNLGEAGLGVSYEVDVVGRLRRAAEAAGADVQAVEAARDLARTTVAADTARAYVEACAAGAQLAVAQRAAEVRERGLEVSRRLLQAGRGGQTDVTRSQGLVEQAQAAIPPLETRRRAALYRLAALTGRPPAEYPRQAEACLTLPRLARLMPVGDGAGLLRRRPDVRQAERTLAGATARIGVATAALYPSVRLGLDAGSSGILGDLGRSAANSWSFGSLITWSVPGGGERARIRQAGAGADAALARFDGVVLNALRETETNLAAYAHELDRNASLRAARDQALAADAEVRALRDAGRSPRQASLDTRGALIAADAALTASDAAVAEDQVAVFLSLGGGWQS